eukprot:XP_001709783.1 Hypothetical protein GL50803_32155 [Giardia lamblia ATCC 50803]
MALRQPLTGSVDIIRLLPKCTVKSTPSRGRGTTNTRSQQALLQQRPQQRRCQRWPQWRACYSCLCYRYHL